MKAIFPGVTNVVLCARLLQRLVISFCIVQLAPFLFLILKKTVYTVVHRKLVVKRTAILIDESLEKYRNWLKQSDQITKQNANLLKNSKNKSIVISAYCS